MKEKFEMRMDIVCGIREAFYPYLIKSTEISEILDIQRPPKIGWISERCGVYYNDYLLDDNGHERSLLFGEFVLDSFGRDDSCTLMYPGLICEENKKINVDYVSGALDSLRTISKLLNVSQMVLYVLGSGRRNISCRVDNLISSFDCSDVSVVLRDIELSALFLKNYSWYRISDAIKRIGADFGFQLHNELLSKLRNKYAASGLIFNSSADDDVIYNMACKLIDDSLPLSINYLNKKYR